MQTSKIKPGEVYAYKRGGNLVRFQVDEIVTRKSADGPAKNEIIGWIVEDGRGSSKFPVDPTDLIGPYAEQAALVERKRLEDAERQEKKEAAEKQARVDRLALYEFVGVTPPAKRDATITNCSKLVGVQSTSATKASGRSSIACMHYARARRAFASSEPTTNVERYRGARATGPLDSVHPEHRRCNGATRMEQNHEMSQTRLRSSRPEGLDALRSALHGWSFNCPG
jgi:hypothetical protein